MQTTQHGGAYYLLEQSFHEGPYLKAHKVLPRRRDDGHIIYPSAAPVRAASFTDDETASQLSWQSKTPLASPPLLNGHESGFPPTPPSNSSDPSQQHVSFSPRPYVDNGMASLIPRKSTASTPVNQRSPPTPDTTPPGSLNTPRRPQPSHFPSPRAESFQTAREDQWSSDGDSVRRHIPLDDTAMGWSNTVESSRLSEMGLGLGFEGNEDEQTPTEERQMFKSEKHNSPKNPVEANGDNTNDMDHIPDREWDTNLMRNVTVRRRRPMPPPEKQTASNHVVPTLDTGRGTILRDRVEEGKQSPRTPTMKEFADDIGWPSELNDVLNSRLRESDSKRLSSISATSTIVEAMIVETPTRSQRRRTLRHTGKKSALRSFSSPEQSSIDRSNRLSSNSDEVPSHRLNHKRMSIPDRRNRDSNGSEDDTIFGSAIPPVPLKHHRQRLSEAASLVPPVLFTRLTDAASNHQAKPVTAAAQPTALDGHSEHSAIAHRRARTNSDAASSHVAHIQEQRTVSNPSPEVRRIDASQSPSHGGNIPRNPSPGAAGALPQAAANGSPSTSPRPQPKLILQPKLADRATDLQAEPFLSHPRYSIDKTDRERRRSSVDRSSLHTEEHHHRPSLDRVPTEELPRVSFDRSTVRTEEYPRMSLDRFTNRSDEHAMARHLYAQVTPFSQFSDTHDALEVSEATAVSIYPHNNKSLLVVQQVARPDTLSRRQTTDSAPTEFIQPTLTVQPSTPPQTAHPFTVHVDSPLKNPRKPPIPPAFKIIPPTPAEELDRQLAAPTLRAEEEARPTRPTRRLSLVQRARRYSDSFIQPLARSFSTARRSTAATHRHQRTPRRAPSVSEQRDTNLHPFWRPRGFWDDLSDSEDDDDAFWGGGGGVGEVDGRDRLPTGGDTSDVEQQQRRPRRGDSLLKRGRRLTAGFRGSGGFLVGNSVGVTRQPTNSRRHHVSLPLGFSPKRSSGGGGAAAAADRVVKRSSSENSLRSLASVGSGRQHQQQQQRTKGSVKVGARRFSVQYVGFQGVAAKLRERRAEKRREKIRRSIGSRFLVEGARVV